MHARGQTGALTAIAALLTACAGEAPIQGELGEIATRYGVAPSDAPRAAGVDPFIGTANDGQTFPGAVRPFGLASPSPHTTVSDPVQFLEGRIANAGYLHGEPMIRGFGLTHLSGVGCPDLGGPAVVPTTGDLVTDRRGYGQRYDNERGHAGFYAVDLLDDQIDVELTATDRVAVQRFFFPDRDGDANVLIDAGHVLSWAGGGGSVRIVSATEVEGSVGFGGFCARDNEATLFFVARFDRPALERGTFIGPIVSDALTAEGRAGAFFRFSTREERPIEVRVGMSYTSTDAARRALAVEATGNTFEALADEAARSWEASLSRITVRGGAEEDRRRFDTALYHTLLHPTAVNDVDAAPRYSVFSLWDTYRTVHPLLTLAYPERQREMIASLAALTDALGAPPRWELLGDEVNMMVGDPMAIVVADSFAKGIEGVDYAELYRELADAAGDEEQRPGVSEYRRLGYVPMDLAEALWGPVSTTLEYAAADAALAVLAEGLGETEAAATHRAHSRGYRALFDEESGLLRPRFADGSFLTPFDPDAAEGSREQPRAGGPGYVEGTAWAYAFMAPHDIDGLVALHGGDDLFAERLSAVFDTDRFAMWNEPDIGYPYLFALLEGHGEKTARHAHDAMRRYFTDGPSGLPGNDDVGALSAWYVLSAIGLYPVNPGEANYVIGTPLFDEILIDRGRGVVTTIRVTRRSPDDIYLEQARLDGAPVDGTIEHGMLVDDSELELTLRGTP